MKTFIKQIYTKRNARRKQDQLQSLRLWRKRNIQKEFVCQWALTSQTNLALGKQ